MKPEDVYALTSVVDPRLSPDGLRVAYTVSRVDEEANAYRTAIWVAPLDGSAEPRQFSSGERHDGSPRWSPDGRWLAFVSNRDGEDEKKAKGQLYVMAADGGEPRKLTDGKESVDSVAWSPDSQRIAFARRVPDEAYEEEDDRRRPPRRFTRVFFKLDGVGWTGDRRKHIFVVGLDGDDERQLTDGDCENDSPEWAPDGERLVFTSMRGDRWDVDFQEALYELEVDGEGAEPKRLSQPDEDAAMGSFSADGSHIAYIYAPEDGTYPHHNQIAVMQADGSDRRILTASLDRQCFPFPLAREPVWDGDRIAFGVEDGGNVHIYTVAADGSGEPELLVGGEQSTGLYDLVDGVLVYTASTYGRPHELFGRDGKELTSVADDFVSGRDSPTSSGSRPNPPTARRSTRGSCARPASTRGRSTRRFSRSTAGPSRNTARASSTRFRSTPPPATASSSRTRAAAPAIRRSGDARSAARATAPGRAGARSTTRT